MGGRRRTRLEELREHDAGPVVRGVYDDGLELPPNLRGEEMGARGARVEGRQGGGGRLPRLGGVQGLGLASTRAQAGSDSRPACPPPPLHDVRTLAHLFRVL